MNVAELMELLRQQNPLMRVLVADANSTFCVNADDLHVVDFDNAKALADCAARVGGELGRSATMTVADLIAILQQHDPRAMVVL